MGIKLFLPNIEGIEDSYKGFYKPGKQNDQDGFLFDFDAYDASQKQKLAEFRDNNRALNAKKLELEATVAKYAGIDPEKVDETKKALEKLRLIDEKKLLEAGKLDEVVEQRTKAMKDQFEGSLKAANTARENAEKDRERFRRQVEEFRIDGDFTRLIQDELQIKPKHGAMPYVLSQVRGVFRVGESGNLEAKGSDGNPIYGKSGQPMTPQEFIEGLVERSSFLFEESRGGGGHGGRKEDANNRVKRIDGSDPILFGRNLERIAKGEVDAEIR